MLSFVYLIICAWKWIKVYNRVCDEWMISALSKLQCPTKINFNNSTEIAFECIINIHSCSPMQIFLSLVILGMPVEVWKKWQMFHMWHHFINIYSLWSNWVSIASGNDLVLNKQQAITWNNVDLALWHHKASLGPNELNGSHAMTQWPLRIRSWPDWRDYQDWDVEAKTKCPTVHRPDFKINFLVWNFLYLYPQFIEFCSQGSKITIHRHWFILWLGAKWARSHCL